MFLNSEVASGEETLRKIVATGETGSVQRAKDVLVGSLMEGLRLDYRANLERIPEARSLIESSVPSDQQIAEVAHGMLGMTLVDTVILPERWETLNRSRQQLRRLQSLVADGQLRDKDTSPQVLADLILRLLDEAFDGRSGFATTGNVTQRNYRIAAAKFRAAMGIRTGNEAQQVRDIVNAGILKRLQETQAEDDVQWWLETSLLSGFAGTVVEATSDTTISKPEKTAGAIRHTALTMLAELPNPSSAAKAGEQLITDAQADNRWLQLADIADRTLGTSLPHGKSPLDQSERPSALSLSRYGVLSEAAVSKQRLQELQASIQDNIPAIPWQGKAIVTESAARSVTPMLTSDAGSVTRNLPFFGPPGHFGGWEFLMARNQGIEVQAYDQAGRPRWTISFGQTPIGSRRRTSDSIWSITSAKYVLAWGNLLALKLDHELVVFDCSTATAQQSPKMLWTFDTRALTRANAFQSRGFERTTQFDMQPSGLSPVGPLTPYGIPVFGGQRLAMLNAFTGGLQWHVRGLPRDCRLTATDNDLLLISESTAQVEVRDLVDGSLKRVTALPAWWTDASENSGSSVYTFQPEDGEDLRWRIAVLDGHCLVYRRNTKAAALESHDLSTNEQEWSIPLPADSLVSNIVNGHVAVLSDTNRLQIYDLHRVTMTADIEVPEAKEGTYLYLRNSGGHWLVITDTAEKDDDKVIPVQQSVPISGRVYAIRQRDGSLSWTSPIHRQWLRTLRATRGPLPPTAPLLTLLQRWYPQSPEEGLRRGPVVYRTKVLDARTGEVLYEDGDVGMGLNYLWTRLNPEKNTIELNFDKRLVTFEYGKSEE